MKAEPLSIRDKKFLVNRLIQQAPTGTLVREFFKNADENAALAAPGNRKIKIYPVDIGGVRKLAFWNTGIGMSSEELRLATDLSSSINKDMALDGNFGIGAKVSGLTMSRAGIRYRSCKDGTVHEITIGYDEEEETYVRYAVEVDEGKSDTVYDVTDVVEGEGQDTSYDWTEVVLYGQSEDHDTVAEPLGKGKSVDRSYIATTIFRRFAEFSPGVEVLIDVSMTKGGGKDETGRNRTLKPLSAVLDKLPNHEWVEDPDSGIRVHYIHDPKHENSSHTLSARANPATASTTFCALIHKGERYDFKTKKGWSAVAPNFGIPFGSKVLTVEISLPADMVLPNQYRDGVVWPEDRSPATADDFSLYVRELMPDWVKEVVKAESPGSDENLDDLQRDLQDLLDEFKVPTTTLTQSRSTGASPVKPEIEGQDQSAPTSFEADLSLDDFELPDGEQRSPASRRAINKKVRKAPEGAKLAKASQALERVPQIEMLIDPEEIDSKNMKGRAGRYYKEAQTLFINGLYPVAERMAAELAAELAAEGEPELVRNAALLASRRSMAFRVGKATCYAISKREADDWSSDDLDAATSPESLSMAADDYKQSLSIAKRWARERIKMAAVVGEEAA